MNNNESHSTRQFKATLYGVEHDNPIPLNSKKRLYMPVWSEDNSNKLVFDGWYHPQTVKILSGSATVTPGPNVTKNVEGTDYTTPSYFEITFTTPGRVQIQVELANIGPSSTTLRATRDYFVANPQGDS